MLYVIANIEIKDIPYSYVIIGFHSFDEFVVLGDDVDSCRVRSNR